VCEVDPSLAVRTSIQRLMTAILSQRACGTRAGLKPAPTSRPQQERSFCFALSPTASRWTSSRAARPMRTT